MTSRDIFRRIETMAQDRGMSRAMLCNRLNVSQATWSNYRKSPGKMKLETIERACQIFMVTMHELTRT